MSSGVDVSQLSDSEKTALDTYTAVTGQEPSAAVPLLRRSEWNVQVSYGPQEGRRERDC
jgi:FAS-associated factor 2